MCKQLAIGGAPNYFGKDNVTGADTGILKGGGGGGPT